MVDIWVRALLGQCMLYARAVGWVGQLRDSFDELGDTTAKNTAGEGLWFRTAAACSCVSWK